MFKKDIGRQNTSLYDLGPNELACLHFEQVGFANPFNRNYFQIDEILS